MQSRPLSFAVVPQWRFDQRTAVLSWVLDRSRFPHQPSVPSAGLPDGATDDRSSAVLVEAFRGDRLVGAVLARALSDSIVEIIPPRLTDGESPATAERLLGRVQRCDPVAEGRLILAYVPAHRSELADMFRSAGFGSSSDVLIMSRDLEGPSPSAPDSGLDMKPYCELRHGQFAEIVASTYTGTRDFAGLGEWFGAEDGLAIYWGATAADRRFWYLAENADRPVGCLLLANSPDKGICELSYLGVVPTARGRGWGTLLLAEAIGRAKALGASQLALGVDSANDPAIVLYARAGFVQVQRHRLLWRGGC